MSIGKIKKPKKPNPWEETAEEMLARLRNHGEWEVFGEFNNITALLSLIKAGLVELDRDDNNVRTSMFTHFRARAVATNDGEAA